MQTSSQPVMIPSSMAWHARPTSTAEVHHLPCVSGTRSATWSRSFILCTVYVERVSPRWQVGPWMVEAWGN